MKRAGLDILTGLLFAREGNFLAVVVDQDSVTFSKGSREDLLCQRVSDHAGLMTVRAN